MIGPAAEQMPNVGCLTHLTFTEPQLFLQPSWNTRKWQSIEF